MTRNEDERPAEHPDADRTEHPDGAARDEQVGRAAERFGRTLGKFARRARPEAERLAQRARPEAERLAQRARAAAEAARPHVERAGRDAIQYARDHEDEIRRAALTGAEFTARRAVPLPLRPIVDAVEADRRRRPPLKDDRAPEDPPAGQQ